MRLAQRWAERAPGGEPLLLVAPRGPFVAPDGAPAPPPGGWPVGATDHVQELLGWSTLLIGVQTPPCRRLDAVDRAAADAACAALLDAAQRRGMRPPYLAEAGPLSRPLLGPDPTCRASPWPEAWHAAARSRGVSVTLLAADGVDDPAMALARARLDPPAARVPPGHLWRPPEWPASRWPPAAAATAAVASWPHGSPLTVDLIRSRLPATTWIGAAHDAGLSLVLWVDPRALAPTPRAPPAPRAPVVTTSPSLRCCAPDSGCRACAWSDAFFAAAFASRSRVAVEPAMAYALACRDAPTRWWYHSAQPPDTPAAAEDGVPADDEGPPDLREAIRAVLSALAAAPCPSPLALPPAAAGATDAAGALLVPWASEARPAVRTPSPRPRDPTTAAALLAELVLSVACAHVLPVPTDFVRASHLYFGVRRRPEEKPRACVDMGTLAVFLRPTTVVYGAPAALLRPGVAAGATADARCAFKVLMAAAQDWPYLCIEYGGWAFTCPRVQFGIPNGPRWWCDRMARVLTAFLEHPSTSTWLAVVAYMDDVGLGASSAERVLNGMLALLCWWPTAGVWVSPRKALWLPCVVLRFLGVLVDWRTGHLRIPPTFATRTAEIARAIASVPPPAQGAADGVPGPVRELVRRLCGKVAFMSQVVPGLGLFTQSLARFTAEPEVARARWSAAAATEAQALAAALPVLAGVVAARAIALPVLFVVFDASSRYAGGAWWCVIGPGWSVAAVRVIDLAAAGFDPEALLSTAAFEAATATAAVEGASTVVRWASLILLGDARAVCAAITRQRAGSAIVPRWSARSAGFAAVLRRFWLACVAPPADPATEAPLLRYAAMGWHRRSTPAAQIADAISDAADGIWRVIAKWRPCLVAAAGVAFDIDLSASSAADAMAPAWCLIGASEKRGPLFERVIRALAGTTADPWPRLTADVALDPFGDAFALLLGPTAEPPAVGTIAARWSPAGRTRLWLLLPASRSVARTVRRAMPRTARPALVAALDPRVRIACDQTGRSPPTLPPLLLTCWLPAAAALPPPTSRAPSADGLGLRELWPKGRLPAAEWQPPRLDADQARDVQVCADALCALPDGHSSFARSSATRAGEARLRWMMGGHCPKDRPARRAAVESLPAMHIHGRSCAVARAEPAPPPGLTEALDAAAAAAAPPAAAAKRPRDSSPERAHSGSSRASSRGWAAAPCGGCFDTIGSRDDARLCDVRDCEWQVCRACAPLRVEHRRLLCPRHMLGLAAAGVVPGAWQGIIDRPTGTIGRLVGRLWARAEGVLAVDMRGWPVLEPPPGAPPSGVLASIAESATDSMWTAARRSDVLGCARRLAQLAGHLGCEEDAVSEFPSLVLAYVERRIRDPLPSWKLPARYAAGCSASTVKSEVSHLAEAMRVERLTAAPYVDPAIKRYLVLSGAFERDGHTRCFPVTTRMLWRLLPTCPERWRPALHTALLQSIYCLRAGTPRMVTWEMLTPCAGGVALRWSRKHKRRQGDRLAPAAGGLGDAVAPQFSCVAGVVIDAVLAYAEARSPGHRPADRVLDVPAAEVTAMLRALLGHLVPAGYRLVAHAIRAGTATALLALGVPREIIRAWGWWQEPLALGTDRWYASVDVGVMLAAARILHLVDLTPVSPGFCHVNRRPAHPAWATVSRPMEPPLGPPGPEAAFDDESSSEEDSRVVEAAPVRPQRPARSRRAPPGAPAGSGQFPAAVAGVASGR